MEDSVDSEVCDELGLSENPAADEKLSDPEDSDGVGFVVDGLFGIGGGLHGVDSGVGSGVGADVIGVGIDVVDTGVDVVGTGTKDSSDEPDADIDAGASVMGVSV